MASRNKRIKTSTHDAVILPDIPEELIEAILSYVPLKKLTQLSILSKSFKNSWKFCKNLSFDANFGKWLSVPDFIHVVNECLMNRRDDEKIQRLHLYCDPLEIMDHIRSWVNRALSLGVEEFELDFSPTIQKICVSLVALENVKDLKLKNCALDLKPEANRFSYLRTIRFQNVCACAGTIDSIFSTCLLLESMELIKYTSEFTLKITAKDLKNFKVLIVKACRNIHKIKINAPNLQSFHYYGKICEIDFKCELRDLNDAVLKITPARRFHLLPQRNHLVTGLSTVRILTASSTLLEGLSQRIEEDESGGELFFFFCNLKEFHLLVKRESFITPYDVANFLQKCVHIERVFIDLAGNSFKDSCFWDSQGRKDFEQCKNPLEFVKYVKIKGFRLEDMPAEMGRYFLRNAKHLETLTLVKARNSVFTTDDAPGFIRQGIPSNAKIEIYDYLKDKNTVFPQN